MRTQINQNFLKSLPIVAGCLGNKLGVRVVLSNVAKTDGDTIYIPAEIDQKSVSREGLLGFIVHEAGHVRYSDLANRPKGIPTLQFVFFNCIEDARIEKLICEEYAGARYLLDTAHDDAIAELEKNLPKTQPQSLFPMYTLIRCEATYHAKVAALSDKIRSRCVKALGESIVQSADRILDEFPAITSVTQVDDMARRLYELLLNAVPQEKNESGSSQPDQQNAGSGENENMAGQSEGDKGKQSASKGRMQKGFALSASASWDKEKDDESDSDKSSASAGSSQSDGEEKSQGASDQNSGTPVSAKSGSEQSSDGSDTARSESGSEQVDEGQPSGSCGISEKAAFKQASNLRKMLKASRQSIKVPDFSEAIRKKLNAVEQPEEMNEPRIFGSFKAEIHAPYQAKAEVMEKSSYGSVRTGTEIIRTAKAESVRARKSLTGIIQARSREGAYTAASGRRIQLSKLSRLVTGSPRVFERREEVHAHDTAVSILLDLSGSVCDDDTKALTAAVALHYALISIPKVKAQLTVFPGCSCGYLESPCMSLIPFGMRPERYSREFGYLKSWGSTPLKETLIQTAVELSKRGESRKVIFVITDGQIAESAGYVLKKLQASGIEAVGIGIGLKYDAGDRMESLFPVWASLEDFSELQTCLLEIAKKLLLAGIS